MGFADGIAKAKKPTGKGEYIKPGNHVFQVDYLKENNGFKGESFVAAFKTIESDSADQPVGGAPAYVVLKKSNNAEQAIGEVREFLSILTGCEFDEVDQDMYNELVGTSQPTAGHFIGCYAWEKETKNGGVWTAYKWTHIGESYSPSGEAPPF